MPSAWGCSRVPHSTHQPHHGHHSLLRLGHRVCKQEHGDICRVKSRTVNSFSRAPRLVAQAVAAEPEVMQTVQVALGDRSYPIYIGQGLLDRSDLFQQHVLGKKVLIVTNETVAPLYLDRCVTTDLRRSVMPHRFIDERLQACTYLVGASTPSALEADMKFRLSRFQMGSSSRVWKCCSKSGTKHCRADWIATPRLWLLAEASLVTCAGLLQPHTKGVSTSSRYGAVAGTETV